MYKRSFPWRIISSDEKRVTIIDGSFLVDFRPPSPHVIDRVPRRGHRSRFVKVSEHTNAAPGPAPASCGLETGRARAAAGVPLHVRTVRNTKQ